MKTLQPDRHTLILIDRPWIAWILSLLWTLFLLALLFVNQNHLGTMFSGNYLLPSAMSFGGMTLMPILAVSLASVCVFRFDRRKRRLSYERKYWWGTRRQEAAFDEVEDVAIEKIRGKYGPIPIAVIRLRSGKTWSFPQKIKLAGALPVAAPDDTVALIKGFLDPDRPSTSPPLGPEREDHRPAAIALTTGALALGLGAWSFYYAMGMDQVPVAAAPPEERGERVERLKASGSGSDLLYVSQAYFEGDGVPQDKAEAVKWAIKSVEAGHLKAAIAVGDMYGHGMGIPQDRVEAHVFYSIGAEAGVAYGQQARAKLERRMTPDQKEEAARRLAAWKAAH